jgi:hypothetical protein
MARTERKKKSNPAGRAQSFADAVKTLEPPFKLLKSEVKVFDQVVASRELGSWMDADLETAAHLAKVTVEMRKVWRQVHKDGTTVTGPHGPVVSPALKAYNTLANIYRAYRSSLGLSASQRNISGHKQKKRNQQDADARKTVAGVSSLFAKPAG